ncbi:MAG: hypothetical protein ACTSXG_02235 [Alphaproteobacteria bacterium]
MNRCLNIITFAKISGLLLIVAGCAPTGNQGNVMLGSNTKAKIYQLINDNITTKSDARKVLGDPSDIDFYENSSKEKWIYTHIDRSSLIRNYVPIMNFFSRGTKDVQKKIILIFNENGILAKSIVTENIGETKYGIMD